MAPLESVFRDTAELFRGVSNIEPTITDINADKLAT